MVLRAGSTLQKHPGAAERPEYPGWSAAAVVVLLEVLLSLPQTKLTVLKANAGLHELPGLYITVVLQRHVVISAAAAAAVVAAAIYAPM